MKKIHIVLLCIVGVTMLMGVGARTTADCGCKVQEEKVKPISCSVQCQERCQVAGECKGCNEGTTGCCQENKVCCNVGNACGCSSGCDTTRTVNVEKGSK